MLRLCVLGRSPGGYAFTLSRSGTLADDSKFRKYQEVTVRAIRPRRDRRPESWIPRPESWIPVEGPIEPGRILGTEHGWSERRERVAGLGERTMCDLIARNHSGSGPDTPSLAVVRAVGPPELLVTPRDREQLDRWQERAEAIDARMSLFDDDTASRPEFEIVPRFVHVELPGEGSKAQRRKGCSGDLPTFSPVGRGGEAGGGA